jgi:hypothetical protein
MVMAFDLRLLVLVTSLYISSLYHTSILEISLSNDESFKRLDSSCLSSALGKEV